MTDLIKIPNLQMTEEELEIESVSEDELVDVSDVELIRVRFYNSTQALFADYPLDASFFNDVWSFSCDEHDIKACPCPMTVSNDEEDMIWVLTWKLNSIIYTDILAWPGDHCSGYCIWAKKTRLDSMAIHSWNSKFRLDSTLSLDGLDSVCVDVNMEPEDTELEFEKKLITARQQIIVGSEVPGPFLVTFRALQQ